MLDDFLNGLSLFIQSVRLFARYPVLLVPLLLTWCVYCPLIILFKFAHLGANLGVLGLTLAVFGLILSVTFLLVFSNTMLLELIKQLEAKQEPNLGQAFEAAIHHDLTRTLPLIFVWAIVWFILALVESLLSNRRNSVSSSLADSAMGAVQKGVRMVIFLILPGIVWENLGFGSAVKKGLDVFQSSLGEFAGTYVLTGVVSAVIFLPPALLLYLSRTYQIPAFLWLLGVLYMGIAWSYSMYLEQMSSACLYLWNMNWEKAITQAQQENRPEPLLADIPQPDLLTQLQSEA